MNPRFCTRCGGPLLPLASYCNRCGGPVPRAAASAAGPPLPAASPVGAVPAGDHRMLWVLLGIVGVVVVIIVALFAIPVGHPFAFELSTPGSLPGIQWMSFPAGAPVSGHWSTVGGGSVTFLLDGVTGPVVVESGASGHFSFTATIGFYEFQVNSTTAATVDVSGSYSAPYL